MQETNLHNSIQTFTVRVTVTVTQNCMIIKTVQCVEYNITPATATFSEDGPHKDMHIYNEIHKHKTLFTLYIEEQIALPQ